MRRLARGILVGVVAATVACAAPSATAPLTSGPTNLQAPAPVPSQPSSAPAGLSESGTFAADSAAAVQRAWVVPSSTQLSDATLAQLSATVRIVIDASGKVYSARITKPSGNPTFDASLGEALSRLRQIPAPPKALIRDYPKVGIILLFEGKDRKR